MNFQERSWSVHEHSSTLLKMFITAVHEPWTVHHSINEHLVDFYELHDLSPWLFINSSKTTAPQQVIFSGKLSTIIIFKLCKFNVNMWTLCFFVLQKVHRPFKAPQATLVHCSFQRPMLNTLHDHWPTTWNNNPMKV